MASVGFCLSPSFWCLHVFYGCFFGSVGFKRAFYDICFYLLKVTLGCSMASWWLFLVFLGIPMLFVFHLFSILVTFSRYPYLFASCCAAVHEPIYVLVFRWF